MGEYNRYTSPDLDEQIAAYYETADNGTVHFLDPSNDERIQPDGPPVCVEEDELCRQGIAKLRELGGRLRVHMLLGLHSSAKDFERQHQQHAATLEKCRIAAIEANYDPGTFPQRIPVLTSTQPGRRAYQDAQMQYLQSHNKQVLPCDIDKVPGELYAALAHRFDLIDAVPDGDAPVEMHRHKLQKMTLELSYQYLRQCAMAAHLGRWYDALDEERLLPAEVIDVAFVLGRGHQRSFAAKLRWFGAEVIEHLTNEELTRNEVTRAEVYQSALTQALIVPEYQAVPWH